METTKVSLQDSCQSKHPTRRQFAGCLLTGSAIAGGAHLFGHVGQANPTDPSGADALSAGIIGAGGIAKFHAANNLKPFFSIRSVCDVDRSHADALNAEFADGAADVYHDHREVLQRDDIDAVFVCTPDHWHTQIAVDALRSGKAVYCEKPLTLTVAEGALIRRVLRETNGILQVGTQQRSDPKFQTAVALARSGRLGKIRTVTVAIGGGPAGGPFQSAAIPESLDWDRWLGQAPQVPFVPQRCHGNFRWWYEYSGGKMTDWGAHHVDIALWAINPDPAMRVNIQPVEVRLPVEFHEGMPARSDCYNTATQFRIEVQLGEVKLNICDEARDLGFDNGILFECEKGRFFVNRGKLVGKPIEEL